MHLTNYGARVECDMIFCLLLFRKLNLVSEKRRNKMFSSTFFWNSKVSLDFSVLSTKHLFMVDLNCINNQIRKRGSNASDT